MRLIAIKMYILYNPIMANLEGADRSQILNLLTIDQRKGKEPIYLPIVKGEDQYGYTPGKIVFDSEIPAGVQEINSSIPDINIAQ